MYDRSHQSTQQFFLFVREHRNELLESVFHDDNRNVNIIIPRMFPLSSSAKIPINTQKETRFGIGEVFASYKFVPTHFVVT